MSEVINDEDKEWERTAAAAQTSNAYNEDARSRSKFSEVRGLCRTCSNALIRRRQYGEVPQVICDKLYQAAHRVPLDIMECSGYEKEGGMELRDMHTLGLIIDPRKKGGQYL